MTEERTAVAWLSTCTCCQRRGFRVLIVLDDDDGEPSYVAFCPDCDAGATDATLTDDPDQPRRNRRQ